MLSIAEPPVALTTDIFRAAMRQFVSQVSIITAGIGSDRSGLVATSAQALSVDPPLMLVCVNRAASTHPLFARYGHFGINLLAPQHQPIAERFSGVGGAKGVERYAVGNWRAGPTGAPLLADAAVALDCDLDESIDRATHTILIGRVRSVCVNGTDMSLAYWRGAYLPVSER